VAVGVAPTAKTLKGTTMSDIPAFPSEGGADAIPDFPTGGKAATTKVDPKTQPGYEPPFDWHDLFNFKGQAQKNVKNLESAADMALATPGMVIASGEDALVRAGRQMEPGQTHKQISAAGTQAYDAIMDKAGSPLHKVLKWAGIGGEGEPSDIDKLMGKAEDLVSSSGDEVARKTQGAINSDDVKSVFRAAMALAGGKGLKEGLTKLAQRTPNVTLDAMKSAPEVERAKTYQAAQEAQEPQAPVEMAGEGATAAVEASAAKTKLVSPKDLTFDPVKGTLEEKAPEIGKELPKPTSLERALEKASNGRRFDLTADERVALRGLDNSPLEQPIIDEQGNVLRRGGRFDREGGAIDPKLMARLAAVGLGAWAGAYFDDENQAEGAIMGGAGALAAAAFPVRGFVNTMKKFAAEDTRIKINELADAHEKYVKLAANDVWALQKKVEELAPDKTGREKITHAIEAGDLTKLNPNQIKAAHIVKDYFTGIGEVASLEGVLTSARENYVTHLWDWSKNKGLFEKWMDRGTGAPGMGVNNRFAEERSVPTIEAGKAQGLTPLTEDISAIMGIYGNSMSRSIANSVFTRALKNEKVPGTSMGLVIKAEDAPHSYQSINNPAMQGLKVHPDIAPSLKMLYDVSSPGAAMKILQGVSDTSKRAAVGFSLFHAKALTDAMIGGTKLTKIPGNVARNWRGMFQPATNMYLEELKKGSASPLVERAAEGGLKYSLEGEGAGVEDAGNSFYSAMTSVQEGLDKMIPHAGLPVKGLIEMNKKLDTFMWARLHAGMKLNVFADKLQELTDNAAKKMQKDPTKALTSDQAARIAASYTNDLFGGLNWRRVAEDSKSYLGRQLGQAMLNPGARRVLGIMMFAPDWTISTTRAAVKAFGGKPDFLRPTTLAGLHQQYLIRAAMYYLVVGDAINYTMSGHHLWDNKDPTVLDMDPKGERHMQWSKHTMEPVHWLTKPAQQAINKLGMIPREATEQALKVDYLSAKGRMAPMKERLPHLAKNFLPISAQQADQGGAGSMFAGFAGVPIYGKTAEQKKKDREERRRKKEREKRK